MNYWSAVSMESKLGPDNVSAHFHGNTVKANYVIMSVKHTSWFNFVCLFLDIVFFTAISFKHLNNVYKMRHSLFELQ